MKILALDPGNSTGWFWYDTESGEMHGGTVVENLTELYDLITKHNVQLVVYETFNMYPGAAKHLTWNEFYPCQVIGVIKLACEHAGLQLIGQSPGLKKFSGGLTQKWKQFVQMMGSDKRRTEHTKDAFLHMQYYLIQNNLCWPL